MKNQLLDSKRWLNIEEREQRAERVVQNSLERSTLNGRKWIVQRKDANPDAVKMNRKLRSDDDEGNRAVYT